MRTFTAILAVVLIAGCQGWQPLNKGTLQSIDTELANAAQRDQKATQPEAVSNALLPPLKLELPKEGGKPLEPRFDLVVNNAPASEVFMSIVSGTRYSMLVHPEVAGSISVNLKDVTVTEALDAIHELYGYDYKVDATRIYVFPLTLQTRVFQVSYLTSQRKGRSELRVTASTAISGSTGNVVNPNDPNASQGGQSLVESADVRTTLTTDFWEELAKSVIAIVGTGAGRSVVVSPQSGVIVVRAMPEELRNVVKYLKASQIAVERQVILEAKILEVQLDTGYQQGINWAAFNRTKESGLSSGQISPGTVLAKQPNQPIFTGSTGNDASTPDKLLGGLPTLVSNPGTNLIATAVGGGIFGLAFQNASFAALLSFLETQGTIHVLSSPRIATLNNQKAVLKVGQDELFVTNVSGGSNTSTGTITTQPTITIPTVTFQSFFSGVALDVTPRIDETDNIILHIHPSVSDVQQVNKLVDTGIAGKFVIPVPRSSVQETDAIVRAQDGQVVVLGGLMRQSQTEDLSQIPTAGDLPLVGPLFRQNTRAGQKRELVILLKPTVVKSESVWSQNIIESKDRITGFTEQSTMSK